ncbi:MAG: Gldg family protein [Clostridia bacterium]|nr:Gldg family protein [Clostridia bacterium]
MSQDKKTSPSGKAGRILKSKQFRYGSVAVAFAVVFIAVVILLNVVVSALASRFGLSVDLTGEQVYGISDVTRQLLKDVDKQVSIKFMLPLDQLEAGSYYPVVICAQNYAREFSNVSVEYYDIITNPQNANFFVDRGYSVTTSDVVVQCGDQFRIYTLSSFMPVAQSSGRVYAFRGEMYFTSGILTVTGDEKHEVTFTTNHSASLPPYLEEIFEFCGYGINRIDLATESISDETDVLVIYDPKNDFQSASSSGGVSEIEKLSDYLMSNRSAMVFVGPFSPAFPHLDELLEEWGVSVTRGDVVLDDDKSLPQYNNQNLICDYAAPADSDAEQIVSNILSSQTICRTASPIAVGSAGSYIEVASVLRSSAASYYNASSDNSAAKTDGPFDVMTLSTRTVIENLGNSINVERKAHLLVCSTTEFASFCADNSFANRSLIFNAIRLMSDDEKVTSIALKRFDDTSLTIEAGEVRTSTVLMVLIVPGLIIAAGVVVWIKRKHL